MAAANPTWTDEQIFQRARSINIAQYQNIVYRDFLPLFLGPFTTNAVIGHYDGYHPEAFRGIFNAFSTAAYRVPHDQTSLPFLVLDSACNQIPLPVTQGVPLQVKSNITRCP